MILRLKLFLAALLLRDTGFHVHRNPVHLVKGEPQDTLTRHMFPTPDADYVMSTKQ